MLSITPEQIKVIKLLLRGSDSDLATLEEAKNNGVDGPKNIKTIVQHYQFVEFDSKKTRWKNYVESLIKTIKTVKNGLLFITNVHANIIKIQRETVKNYMLQFAVSSNNADDIVACQKSLTQTSLLADFVLYLSQDYKLIKQALQDGYWDQLQVDVELVHNSQEMEKYKKQLIIFQMVAFKSKVWSSYNLEEYMQRLGAIIRSCERILFLKSGDPTDCKELQELRRLCELLATLQQGSKNNLIQGYESYVQSKKAIMLELLDKSFEEIDEIIKLSLLDLCGCKTKEEFSEIGALFGDPSNFVVPLLPHSTGSGYFAKYDVLLRIIEKSYGLTKQKFDESIDKQRLVTISKIDAIKPCALIANVLQNAVTVVTSLSSSPDMCLYRYIKKCDNISLANEFLKCFRDDSDLSRKMLFGKCSLIELISIMSIDSSELPLVISSPWWSEIRAAFISNLTEDNIGALPMPSLIKLISVLDEQVLNNKSKCIELLTGIEKAIAQQSDGECCTDLARVLQARIDNAKIKLSIDAQKTILTSKVFQSQSAQLQLANLQQQYDEETDQLVILKLGLSDKPDAEIEPGSFRPRLFAMSTAIDHKIADAPTKSSSLK